MKNNVEFWVSHNYGGWSIVFSKKFEIDFVPFYGLWFNDYNSEYEIDIRLENNEYCTTIISYDLNNKTFNIDIRNLWKFPVRNDVVDEIVNKFSNSGWIRRDITNLNDLKSLMNRNANTKTRI